MGALFTMLWAKLAAVVKWFGDLFIEVFVSLWEVVADFGAWVFEQLMEIVVSAVSVLDFTAISDQLVVFQSIPPVVLEVLAASGIGTALSIIASALLVRVGLQLIPFVRLGS